MKKIILLLTVLTLGVIACDKNELGDMDSSSINAPIEATIEVDVMDHDFDAVIGRLLNLSKANTPSTSKSVTAGDTFTLLFGFSGAGEYFEFVISDDVCGDTSHTYLSEVVFTYQSSSLTELSIGGQVFRSLNRDLGNLFGVDWRNAWKFDATGVIGTDSPTSGLSFSL